MPAPRHPARALSHRPRAIALAPRRQAARKPLIAAAVLLAGGLWWGLAGQARAEDHGHGHGEAAHAAPPAKNSKSGKVQAEAAPATPAPVPAGAAADEHGASDASAATPKPVAAPGAPMTMQDLQSKLSEKIGEVRAAYAAKAKPAGHGAPRAKAAAAGHGAAAKPVPAAAPDAHAALHWGYAGPGGPKEWGAMKPEFAACSSGQRQSPIDIRDGIGVDLPPIQFDYRPSAFSVLDNGHTVQVNVERGNAITVSGRRFELVQFHFHRPSEERINGRGYEMVAHLVHKDLDGKLAVVAVLIDQGKAHPLVQQVWNNLPLEKNEEQRAGVQIDLNALLPGGRGYYTYMGSLTTPPCSEGVLWMVMKQPTQLSAEQIAIFAKLYPMNARPIQSAAGRLIKESAAATTLSSAAP